CISVGLPDGHGPQRPQRGVLPGLRSGQTGQGPPCVVSFRENHWRGLADHRTVATPTWAATPSRSSYLHHSVGRHLSGPLASARSTDLRVTTTHRHTHPYQGSPPGRVLAGLHLLPGRTMYRCRPLRTARLRWHVDQTWVKPGAWDQAARRLLGWVNCAGSP